jgi:hypothetical protein
VACSDDAPLKFISSLRVPKTKSMLMEHGAAVNSQCIDDIPRPKGVYRLRTTDLVAGQCHAASFANTTAGNTDLPALRLVDLRLGPFAFRGPVAEPPAVAEVVG